MKVLFDNNFYDKTLGIANAKVTGNLTGYLAESREIPIEDVDDEYYSVVIVVQNYDGTNRDIDVVAEESKDSLVDILTEQHNAKDVYRADELSFVSASIPASQIHKMSEYGEVYRVGDGEGKLESFSFTDMAHAKQVVNANDVGDGKTYDYTGDGVKVGIIDADIPVRVYPDKTFDYVHLDLPKNIFKDVILCPNNLCRDPYVTSLIKSGNHSTFIAGIIAGQDVNGMTDQLDMKGVSPEVDLYAIGLRGSDGDNNKDEDEDKEILSKTFLSSLDWALSNGIDVASSSIGYTENKEYTSDTIIVDEAVDKGLLLVIANGNTKHDVNYFAKGFNNISVGAIDENKQYSNWCNIQNISNCNAKSSIGPISFTTISPNNIFYLNPDIVAPGTDVKSLYMKWDYSVRDGYVMNSGTSFATPFVAGAAALLKEASPGITPMEIRAALLVSAEWDPQSDITQYPVTAKIWEDIAVAKPNSRTTHQTNTYDYLNKYGFGVLDIEGAIDTVTTPDHLVRDYFEDSITPKTYTTEQISSGEQVKILLTWDIHPIDTIAKLDDPRLVDGAQPYHHYSNNDFTITSPSGVSISSDSAYQNKEFIVFTASESGRYTVTISNGYLSSVGGQDNFALASNFALTSSSSKNTHFPTVHAVEQFTMSTLESELLIAVSGNDQDNNPLSFVITDEPDYGTLSVGEQFGPKHTYFRYHLNSGVSSVTQDTFSIKAFDGKNYSAEKTLSIKTESLMDGSITKTNLNAPDNLNTKTLSFSAPTTKQFSVDSLSAIQSIYARSSNVVGSTLHFTSSGNSYTMKIPDYSARTIVFDKPSTVSNVYITTAGLTPSASSGLLSLGYSKDISEISSNSIPVANDVTTDASADNPIQLTLTGVDSDLGAGESLDFVITDTPKYGALSSTIHVPNTTDTSAKITYTAHSTYSGVDSFSYVVRDDQGASSKHATVTINVSPPNLEKPTAYSQTTQTSQNESITMTLSGFDPQDEQLTFSILTGTPAHGVTSSVTPLGKDSARITYTPDSNYIGDDTISFRASNGLKHSQSADIVISITPHTNNPPTALPDSVSIAEDSAPYTMPVLSNDLDADISDFSDSIQIHSIDDSGLVGGTAVISADKTSISFTPNQNYDQTSRFYYTIMDSHGEISSLAPVTVTIIPQNDSPIASADHITAKKDSVGVMIDVLNNDFDVDTGDSITITSVDNTGTSGVASIINSGKKISFTPSVEYTGTTSFTYDISDDNGASSTATVTINVNSLEGQAMFVIDYHDAEIKAYHPITGEYIGTLVTSRSGGLSSPSSILFNGVDDYVLVSDFAGKIFQYNATTGQYIDTVISNSAISPRDMAWGPDGNLYVADVNSKILMYDVSNGFVKSEFISNVYGGSSVRSLEFDNNGDNLYVETSSNRIIKYDGTTGASQGVIVNAKDQSNFSASSGFTIGSDKKFYILDGYNNKIVRYTQSGQYDGEFLTSTSGLSLVHLNWGPDGYLYVSGEKDYKAQIYRYAIDGTLVDLFVGKYSNGGLRYPHGVIFANIPFFVPDVINDLNISVQSTSRILINWSEPDSRNSDISGYIIERRETLGTSSFQVIFDGLPKGTSYTDTNLDEDTSYTYRISSYNIVGKSLTSGDVTSVTMQESANTPPITNDDVYYISKNISTTLPVLNNDYDIDDDTITITTTSTPENGTVIINQNNPNTITFTPDAGFMGQDIITYTILAGGDSTTGVITVILQDPSEYPMYVASERTDSIALFSSDGQYRKQFVSAGSGGLDAPRALAISPDGNYMYVSDTRNDKILQYHSHNGTFVDSITSTDFADPSGMAFGPDGYLYVSSEDKDKILQIDTHAGVSLGTFGFAESENSPIDSPQKIAWHDDHLYVASGQSETILRYDSMGIPVGVTSADPDNGGIFSDIPDYDYPASVSWGPDGSLYVGDSRANKIYKIDGTTGVSLGQYDTGGIIDNPLGLTFDYSIHGAKK